MNFEFWIHVTMAALFTIFDVAFLARMYHTGFQPGVPMWVNYAAMFWALVYNPLYVVFILYRAHNSLKGH